MIPYPSYKSTNLPWLPKIPEHWEAIKIRELFVERNQKVSDKDFAPLSVSKGGIVPQIATVAKTDNGENRKLVREGDFVINSRSDRKGSSGISAFDGSVSLINLVLRPRVACNRRYLHYLLKSIPFVEEYYRNGRGIVADLWTTRYSEMKTISIPFPSSDEQEQIVRYLDSMTAKINKLIRAKKKQIALLQEQRQAIINQAVTRGLDPNVEMKDSGIDWLGKIPKHWNVCKVKHLCSMQAGDNLTADVIQETGEYPVYGANGRRGFYHAYNLNNNCLLVGRQGALCGNVHIVFGKIWATDHAVVTVPTKRTHVSYLYYLLLAMNLNQYALETAAQPGLSVSVIQNLPTLLVPLDEQQEIASFLDKQTAIIDAAIDKMKASIKALNEYKNSLISSVVTGQTDVRNIPVEDVIPDDLIPEDVPTSEIEEEPTEESEE